jgi:fucose permease
VKVHLGVLAGLAFISLGLPDGLVGVAWPSIRTFFGHDVEALGVLLVAGTSGYVTSSFFSGRLLRHLNVGAVLALSCAFTAIALLGYANASQWPVIIAFSALLGFGGGAIDSSLNTYAATHHGARTLNWLHACYGIGAAVGPVIMTAVLGRGLPWQRGYLLIGLAQLALGICFAATSRRWLGTTESARTSVRLTVVTIPATLRLPAARLAIAAFFMYAGVEASFGVWTYTLLTEGRGVAAAEAAGTVSLFWAALTGGRLLAAFVAGVPPRLLLRLAMLAVTVGAALVWMDAHSSLTVAGILLAGCACGPIFPTLVATTPGRLGEAHAPNAVGFQIAAAALGLSLLPGVVGMAAGVLGVNAIASFLLAMAVLLMAVYRMLERVSMTSSKPTDAGLPSARDLRNATRSSNC